jgi:Na+/Pi-cotransporter
MDRIFQAADNVVGYPVDRRILPRYRYRPALTAHAGLLAVAVHLFPRHLQQRRFVSWGQESKFDDNDSIIGGIGLFLLGMAVMTDGLKALAGTALRGVLAKAPTTRCVGTFWGAVITLLVQPSSATIMTTIGLVSAGS